MKRTLKEFMEDMPKWDDQERLAIKSLVKLLSPLSISTLKQFESEWDGRRPYEEFVVAQNKEIEKCVTMEKSMFGTLTRKNVFGLPPLTDETEVIDEA
jgi:hypothetical protein